MFNDFTVEVRYRDGPVPTLTVDAAVVDRLGRSTFTVNAEPNAVVTNWRFTGEVGTVERTTNTNARTWQGRVVAPGVVGVRVEQNGETWDLGRAIDVTPRNWTWTAPPPRRANALTTFVSPPAISTRIGISALEIGFRFSSAERITDQGPNNGFIFVERFNDVSRDPRAITRFRYQITDDLNKNAAFYRAQCGSLEPAEPERRDPEHHITVEPRAA